MVTDVLTVRLPPRDTEMIDLLVEQGAFASRSDFLRFAVKRAVTEHLDRELRTRTPRQPLDETDLDDLLAKVREVRAELWRGRHG